MTYYLQDNPNLNFAQFGWPRTKVSGVIGVHTTESGVVPAGPDGGAENTAAFIQRRTDPGSYHCMGDADSRMKLVHPRYAAWADTTNNAHAMSVSGAMNAARWRDLTPERAAAIVRNMAYAAADLVRDALAAGLLDAPVPARRITAAEAIAGTRPGFYGHGETNPLTRYDPGQNFDWDLFLKTYATAVGGGLAAQGTITPVQEDDVSAQEVMAWPIERVDGQKTRFIDEIAKLGPDLGKLDTVIALLHAIAPQVTESMLNDRKQVGALVELKTAIAKMPPAELAAQIDAAGAARQVLDELAKLIGGTK